MRFHFYCVIGLLSLLLALVGCGPEPGCGWFGCGEGERCVNSGNGESCVACGQSGQPCCYQVVGGEYCTTSGYGCDPGDGPGTCSKDCGALGKQCCDGTACDDYPNEQTCNTNNVCEGTASNDPCFSGSNTFVLNIITPGCGSYSQLFLTNTLEEAEECAANWPVAAGEQKCTLGEAVTESHVCPDDSSFGNTFFHCTAEQLETCQTDQCSDCTWGECPPP